ncbi:hypothetical protein [Enterobacter kobei]|uniref:hypothetical protein n=2 Tax=Enterobacteriaceae TaxID=543 RepID=UPI00099426D8|nr:hypothetical protein [Enterobacter kobei]OOV69544.1 hypothetical protein B1742_24725 [Enterobacter kobei]
MLSNRYYILRVCIPTYLLPFLPPIREQFILESECAHDYISIYIIIDKYKVKNPIIFYGLFAATLKCNKLNDEELSEEEKQRVKEKTLETAKISIIFSGSTELADKIHLTQAAFNSKETNPQISDEELLYNEFEVYKDISAGDFEVIILDDEKHNLIPTENEEQTELFKKCIECVFDHRISLLSSIKNLATAQEKAKPNNPLFRFKS